MAKIYSHDLEELADLAGLKPALNNRMKAFAPFNVNWVVVSAWSEQARYGTTDPSKSISMIEAVSDHQAGVLPWLKTYW